jgi:hypothetical protein
VTQPKVTQPKVKAVQVDLQIGNKKGRGKQRERAPAAVEAVQPQQNQLPSDPHLVVASPPSSSSAALSTSLSPSSSPSKTSTPCSSLEEQDEDDEKMDEGASTASPSDPTEGWLQMHPRDTNKCHAHYEIGAGSTMRPPTLENTCELPAMAPSTDVRSDAKGTDSLMSDVTTPTSQSAPLHQQHQPQEQQMDKMNKMNKMDQTVQLQWPTSGPSWTSFLVDPLQCNSPLADSRPCVPTSPVVSREAVSPLYSHSDVFGINPFKEGADVDVVARFFPLSSTGM